MSTASDHAPLLERAFDIEHVEGSYVVDDIEGEVPAYLRGSYYLNGPARFRHGEQRYEHWLDGDGLVCRLHFGSDGVRFTNRFVRSTKYRDEQAAGRALYRAFGTRFEGDRLLHGVGLESPANVSAYMFGGRLLAFGEQGLPWELDPVTLETRQRYTFGDKLNTVTPFSAHAHFDPASGEMFNFGVSFSARRPSLSLYRFGADGAILYRARLPIEHPASMHDFHLSPNYAVFYLSPHVLDMDALMTGGRTVMEALRWEPQRGTRLIIARREDGQQAASIPIGCGYCLHLINSFEQDGRLVVDVVELERPIYDQYDVPQLFTEVRTAEPKRYVVNVQAGVVEETHAFDYRLLCDFPAIDPRRWGQEYRDFWLLGISATPKPGRKFLDQLVHCEWGAGPRVYQVPAGRYLGGEPIFLPDPRHDRGGTVICQELDVQNMKSAFLLFDAHDVARGPVARLTLKDPVRLGFHASFAAEEAPAA